MTRLCRHILFAGVVLGASAADRNPPPWEKPLRAGRYLYRENCSVCHEINRPKRYKFGPNLFRLFQNEKLPLSGGKPTEEYVTAKIKNGGPVMPAFRDVLSEEQIADLIAFIRSRQ
ncbi:MAG TPA: cytochrome c [Bryobacteraceae bacterium]|nr:cytochrome c [Bryobacteraceae bacterium]